MRAIKISKDKVVLEIFRDDFGALSNTLNEVCNGIEVLEFETKIGISREEARGMLKFLSSTYDTALHKERFE